jgi:diadenosine tetraphosphate (Ap4A) HIT family hydrolase
MNCPFCEGNYSILNETKLSFAIFDNFPVSRGHALVIPKRHVATVWELTGDEYADIFDLVKSIKDIIQNKFSPQGINVGVNCGEAAGQTVFHAHIHVIPRYAGDVPNPRGGVRNVIPGKEIISRGWVHQRPLPDRFGGTEDQFVQVCFMESVGKTRAADERKQSRNLET